MGLSLTPITHVSASPLFDPGRSVFPSPILTLAFFLGRLPIAGEAQVLTHIHPYPQWFTPDSVSMPVLRPSMSGTSETAKCPEPLRLSEVLPLRAWSSLHLERHYPFFFAATDSSANPKGSGGRVGDRPADHNLGGPATVDWVQGSTIVVRTSPGEA